MGNPRHVLMEWDWVYGFVDDHEELHYLVDHDWDDNDVHGPGTSACGVDGDWSIPGMGSRMGSMRCGKCCTVMGFPPGKGSPKNDDACRPLVELRLPPEPRVLHEGAGL